MLKVNKLLITLFMMVVASSLHGQGPASWSAPGTVPLSGIIIPTTSYTSNDSFIRKEFLSACGVMYTGPVSLRLVDAGDIISHPTEGVTISRSQLKNLYEQLSEREQRNALRIVLAHELAHQLQFKKISQMKDTPENRTLLECQADIYAGYIYGYFCMPELAMTADADQKGSMQSLYKILELVYNLGIKEYSIGMHPSQKERLTAFQLGAGLGLVKIFFASAESNMPGVPDPATARSIIDETKNYIDYPDNTESLFDWSMRQAKKVMNHFDPACNNIVLLTSLDSRFKYDTNPDNRVVTYNLLYKNISAYPIELDMEVALYHIKKNDPEVAKYHKKVNNHNYKLTLGSGEEKLIKGTLPWHGSLNSPNSLAEGDTPRLVYPGHKDGLISCRCKPIQDAFEQDEELIGELRLLNSQQADFEISFQKLLRAARRNFEGLKSGIGKKEFANKNEYAYPTSLLFGDNITTLLIEDIEDPTYRSFRIMYTPQNTSTVAAKAIEWEVMLNGLQGYTKSSYPVPNGVMYRYDNEYLSINYLYSQNNFLEISVISAEE